MCKSVGPDISLFSHQISTFVLPVLADDTRSILLASLMCYSPPEGCPIAVLLGQ